MLVRVGFAVKRTYCESDDLIAALAHAHHAVGSALRVPFRYLSGKLLSELAEEASASADLYEAVSALCEGAFCHVRAAGHVVAGCHARS